MVDRIPSVDENWRFPTEIQTALQEMYPTRGEVSATYATKSRVATKCVRLEAGRWVWDTPGGTHFVIPDSTGALIVRATPWPTPDPTTPAFNW